MSNFTIANGKNIPLNLQTGTIPSLTTALLDWMQLVTFGLVTKTVVGYQADETITNINFFATIQPLTERALVLKPEGQRAWTWFLVIAQAAPGGALISLNVDDVGIWNGKQTRVMARKDHALYGFTEMSWVQDWTGSGPPTP